MSQSQDQFHRQLDGNAAIPAKPAMDIASVHPKRDEAMKVFERIQRERRMRIDVDIKSIASVLVHKEKVEQIPEPVFVEFFLPMFAGEVEETQAVNYQTWIEKVSGKDTAPVEVIDENFNVLYVVPPLLDMSVIEQTRPGGNIMTVVERKFSRLKEIDVAASDIFLSKTLEGMHVAEKPSQQSIDNIKAWNAIFVRYGRADKILNLGNILEYDTKKEETTPGNGNAGVSNNDTTSYELDYD